MEMDEAEKMDPAIIKGLFEQGVSGVPFPRAGPAPSSMLTLVLCATSSWRSRRRSSTEELELPSLLRSWRSRVRAYHDRESERGS